MKAIIVILDPASPCGPYNHFDSFETLLRSHFFLPLYFVHIAYLEFLFWVEQFADKSLNTNSFEKKYYNTNYSLIQIFKTKQANTKFYTEFLNTHNFKN